MLLSIYLREKRLDTANICKFDIGSRATVGEVGKADLVRKDKKWDEKLFKFVGWSNKAARKEAIEGNVSFVSYARQSKLLKTKWFTPFSYLAPTPDLTGCHSTFCTSVLQ